MFFRKRRCSFCGRSEAEVDKLVAGPRVYICDRCAYETIRIMESTPTEPPQVEARQSA
jgi:ATP-dependent Clp protease ATP-binding subunit ClpX